MAIHKLDFQKEVLNFDTIFIGNSCYHREETWYMEK